MVKDAGIYRADCIMFDLEDSVPVTEKDAARFLVCEALETIDYNGKELLVRINALDSGGLEDLEAVVRTGKAAIRLPKAETAKDIEECDREIGRIEEAAGLPIGSTKMMATIESALGVLNAQAIAAASKRLIAIAIGAEDFITDIRAYRSSDGLELMFGRSMVLLAARAAGIDAIDTVYSDVNDEEGFLNELNLIRKLGFDGKSVINPRQIHPVHEAFTPEKAEIENAAAVMEAIGEAERRGSGVIALNGEMIDKPVALRAQRVLDLAAATGGLRKEAPE